MMKYRDYFTKAKPEVIRDEIDLLNEFKSYKEGLRRADEQAERNYQMMKRSVEAKRHFKIIYQDLHPTVIWSYNGSLTMIIYDDGFFKYDDEITGGSNYCRVIGASARDFTPFYGTVQEVIEAAKNNYVSDHKQLPPVEHCF